MIRMPPLYIADPSTGRMYSLAFTSGVTPRRVKREAFEVVAKSGSENLAIRADAVFDMEDVFIQNPRMLNVVLTTKASPLQGIVDFMLPAMEVGLRPKVIVQTNDHKLYEIEINSHDRIEVRHLTHPTIYSRSHVYVQFFQELVERFAGDPACVETILRIFTRLQYIIGRTVHEKYDGPRKFNRYDDHTISFREYFQDLTETQFIGMVNYLVMAAESPE